MRRAACNIQFDPFMREQEQSRERKSKLAGSIRPQRKNTEKSFRAANTERQSSRILFIVIVRYVNDVNYIVDEQNDYIILNYLIFVFLFLTLARSIALFLHTNYTILISLIVVSVDCRHRRFEF